MNRLLFVFLISVYACSAWVLDKPRVVLPLFKSYSANFTLTALDYGCCKWRLSRKDIVQLVPLNMDDNTGCANKVMLSTITKDFVRNIVVVLVEETYTGYELRCDIIVDVISSLRITTKTRKLYVDDVPEKFEVSAYDEQGNAFSTLEDVEFVWTIDNIGQPNPPLSDSVLKLITFRDSTYDIPESIAKLENKNLTGHIVMIQGVKTGTAKISARLKQPEYSHVPPVEVTVNVVTNLVISPSEVHILQGDTVEYKLLQMRGGKLVEVAFPSSRYFLEIENRTVANDIAAWTIEGTGLGRSEIRIRDPLIDVVDESDLTTATVTVNTPKSLRLVSFPQNNWVFVESQPNAIAVEIYSVMNHEIRIGPSVVVKIYIDEADYYVTEKTPNGTYIEGWPRRAGIMRIRARLHSVINHAGEQITFDDDDDALSTERNVSVYAKLSIVPSVLFMPWHPSRLPDSAVRLEAVGGDNIYDWSVDNSSVASFDSEPANDGLLSINYVGSCTVTVRMRYCPKNEASARVRVVPIVRMKILNDFLESQVDSPAYLHIALYGYYELSGEMVEIPFTRCSHIPFKFTFFGGDFSYTIVPASSNDTAAKKSNDHQQLEWSESCVVFEIIGRMVTVTKLTVSLDDHHDYELEDHIAISTFDRLQVLVPSSRETVLAVGSQRQLVYGGGEKFSSSNEIDLVVVSQQDHRKIISVVEVYRNTPVLNMHTPPGLFIYLVTCNAIGESVVWLRTSNAATADRVNTEIRVICAKPRYVELIPAASESSPLAVNDFRAACPQFMTANYGDNNNDGGDKTVTALNSENFTLEVIVKDEYGRKFDNATSLKIKWSFSDPSLATVLYPAVIRLEEMSIRLSGGQVVRYALSSRYYQIIEPKGITGKTDVHAAIVHYHSGWLRHLEIISEEPPFGILNSIGVLEQPTIKTRFSLTLVGNLSVVPDAVSIIMHPENKVTLNVTGGSGYYEVSVNASNVVNIITIAASDSKQTGFFFEIIPVSNGTVNLTVKDACLNTKPVFVPVRVSALTGIKVEMNRKLEKGRRYRAALKFYDSPIISSSLKLLQIRTFVNPNRIVRVAAEEDETDEPPMPQLSESSNALLFQVDALTVGFVNLTFSAALINTSFIAYSEPIIVEVFNRLVLSPADNITVMPGSIMQVFATGGPTTGSTIEYLSADPTLVAIDERGVFRAISTGRVNISALAVDSEHNIDRPKVIYSEARASVNVVKLTGIKIEVPSSSFLIDTEIPAWIISEPVALGSLALGSVKPSLEFAWNSFDSNVAKIYNVFYNAGIRGRNANMFSVRIKGLQRGNTTISVAVTVPSQNQTFVSSTFVEFLQFRLIEPPCPLKRSLLITSNTVYPISVNVGKEYKVTYRLLELFKSSTVDVASINSDGVLTTFNRFGKFLIEVIVVKGDYRDRFHFIGEVAPVRYMMINASPTLYPDGTDLATLPCGVQLKLHVTYHDKFGSPFTYVKNNVKYRFSARDKVTVLSDEDDSLLMRLETVGETTIEVYDGSQSVPLRDYVKLSTTSHILPQQIQVVVGDVIYFSIPHLSENTENGKWTSLDDVALSLEPTLGIAKAVWDRNGVIVNYAQKNGVSMKTTINISPLKKILFLSTDNRVTNNGKVHVFPLLLLAHNEDVYDRTNNLVTTVDYPFIPPNNYTIDEFPFHCAVRFESAVRSSTIEQIFSVKEHFDFNTGLYACVLEDENDSVHDDIESNIILSAILDHIYESRILNFIPAVRVFPQTFIMNCTNPAAVFFVDGQPNVLDQIRITSDDNALRIEHSIIEKQLIGSIYLTKMYDASVSKVAKIGIMSSVTDQLINIVVNMTPDTNATCFLNIDKSIMTFEDVLSFKAGLTVLFGIITIICIAQYGFRKSRVQPAPMDKVIFNKTSKLPSFAFDDIRPIYGTTPTRPVHRSIH